MHNWQHWRQARAGQVRWLHVSAQASPPLTAAITSSAAPDQSSTACRSRVRVGAHGGCSSAAATCCSTHRREVRTAVPWAVTGVGGRRRIIRQVKGAACSAYCPSCAAHYCTYRAPAARRSPGQRGEGDELLDAWRVMRRQRRVEALHHLRRQRAALGAANPAAGGGRREGWVHAGGGGCDVCRLGCREISRAQAQGRRIPSIPGGGIPGSAFPAGAHRGCAASGAAQEPRCGGGTWGLHTAFSLATRAASAG